MPKVGKKKFPYNSKGIAAAQAESKATGQDMVVGEGVNVSRDAALSKSDKIDYPLDSKKGSKKGKKSAKKNPFAKKGGY